MSSQVRILGVGSPHGDDQLGWLFARQLDGRTTAQVVAIGQTLQLLDYLEKCRLMVIVDACVGDARPGTITRLQWPDPRLAVRHARGTHGLSIGAVLRLAETLGRVPDRIVVYGVEIEANQCGPIGSISPVTRSALSRLEAQVLQEVSEAVRAQ